ncbi:hypothetical protein [Rickettsiella endosymbiont of Dermanyssus gallinae]|uniref:hypothetical protein n=1 Tax=Rickettsiella endosymbiont of Dermanyssus gallinae TaxID=2856608 RepID=UPI001C52F8AF|nr:hypothetical protein [Rickettsiella endosymbiont of Dermanyssus gallinae]
MIITKKLFYLLKIIQSSDHPKQALLSEEHKKLVALLDSGLIPYSFPKSIKELNPNQVHKTFNLYTDPTLFKTVITKIADQKIIAALLNIPSEISFSLEEKNVLNEQLSVLKLLANLKQDLKEVAEFGEQYENLPKSFFEKYFRELHYLKFTFTRPITIDDIAWLLHTNIFDLIATEPEIFIVKLTDFYQKMIQRINQPVSKKDFNQHCQLLLDKKTRAGGLFNYGAF